MAEHFHYPPEVFNLLVDTLPLLCRSKQDVVQFFVGAGVENEDLSEVARIVRTNRESINKFEIVRNVLTKVNARGDSGLRPRREILKRVTEFENFDTCWDSDRLKAQGLVAVLSKTINVKDSFTRMKQERDTEKEKTVASQRTKQQAAAAKRDKIVDINNRLSALFGMDDRPQERGKLLESVLNDLFRVFGIDVREDFRRRDPDTGVVVEQIDGVIELDGKIHLVEMKWLNAPVGIGEFSPHLSRLFLRGDASGIFISSSGYAKSVLSECSTALTKKTIFLCSLQEFVMLLQRQGDLLDLLRRKHQAAIVEKNPFLEILV